MNGDVEKTRQDDEAFLTVVVFPLVNICLMKRHI